MRCLLEDFKEAPEDSLLPYLVNRPLLWGGGKASKTPSQVWNPGKTNWQKVLSPLSTRPRYVGLRRRPQPKGSLWSPPPRALGIPWTSDCQGRQGRSWRSDEGWIRSLECSVHDPPIGDDDG